MFRISLALIFTHTSLAQIYNKTADGIIESIIGNVSALRKIDPPKRFSQLRDIEDQMVAENMKRVISINNTHVKLKYKLVNESFNASTTTERMPQVTPLPENKLNLSIDDIKTRMRKIHLNQLLVQQTNPIPDFSKDEDSPAVITRRFDRFHIQATQKKNLALRPNYFWNSEDWRLMYQDKQRTLALMAQFVYAARYKMPYVQLLRKKYSYHYKYKIGYCFALLRHLKQQQKLIYTSMKNYYTTFTSLMVHLKLYEKVVRLDVDIKDLVTYLRRLNFERKLDEDPTYYDSSTEDHGKRPFGMRDDRMPGG